jgi:hypothetical protein
MYALIVETDGATSITIYNHLDDANLAYEETPEEEAAVLLKVGVGKPFGLNTRGSFGGDEINSNL